MKKVRATLDILFWQIHWIPISTNSAWTSATVKTNIKISRATIINLLIELSEIRTSTTKFHTSRSFRVQLETDQAIEMKWKLALFVLITWSVIATYAQLPKLKLKKIKAPKNPWKLSNFMRYLGGKDSPPEPPRPPRPPTSNVESRLPRKVKGKIKIRFQKCLTHNRTHTISSSWNLIFFPTTLKEVVLKSFHRILYSS